MSNNYTIIDAFSAQKEFKSTETDGVNVPHHHLDSFPAQHIDSFSRLRVSNPAYRFDSQLTYQIDDDLWDVVETGDGAVSHDATNRMAALVSGATAGANTAILQSHYHAPYTPGRGQLIFITFNVPDAIPTNGEVGCGYYDGTNGIFLKQTASGVSLNVESSTDEVIASVPQASWNVDPMDGNGPSGILLDTAKTNILVISLQALYVGVVVVGFDVDGQLYPVHAFYNANRADFPYIAQASLPVRYWATTSTDAAAATINAICCTVISEGGEDLHDIPGRQFPITGALSNAASGTLLVVRAKSQLNGINSNVLGIPTDLDVSVSDSGCWVNVRVNATVTAGDFTDIDSKSAFQASFAGNAGTDPTINTATGTLIDRFWLPATASIRTTNSRGLTGKAVLCYSHLLAAGDVISIDYDGGSGTTDVQSSLKLKEVR